MITWTDAVTKTQRLAKTSNMDTLTQLKQDINTGYHMFNAKLGRYYSRKQQFTNLITGQQQYQTPIDCVRVLGMTVLVSQTYQPPVKEIRSEYEWRQITSYPYTSNWPAYYFMVGNDQLALWPVPSQDVALGLRFYYQPQDHDLSIDDITSTSTAQTVTVANGSPLITATGSAFSAAMIGLSFQATGVPDLTAYEVVAASSNTLTLKSAFVGPSASSLAWRIGQVFITPPEYTDAPMHYALSNFFSSQGNEARGTQHMNTFNGMVTACEEDYSSSTESAVIDSNDMFINPWIIPPVPGPIT